jgi:serine/threonine protein kinase
MAGPKTPDIRDEAAPHAAAVEDGVLPEPSSSSPSPSASVSIGTGRSAAGSRGATFRPNVTSFWIPAVRDADHSTPAASETSRLRVAPGPSASPERDAPPLAGSASNPVDDAHEVGANAHAGRIPFRVGNYEVATRIAQGGVGSIYVCRKADAIDEARLYVLKVVRQHASREDTAAESFRQEARVGALFQHPHAQTVIDRGMYENQPFLILDYNEGLCLADLLAGENKPTPAVVVAVLLQVLSALEGAHQVVDRSGKRLGLVHCDVSAENILVGIDGSAWLTDFGSSRFTATTEPMPRKSFALAKPASMSPEQFRGEVLDARSDIFSLGVVLWTALTGQSLFAAPTYDQTMMNVMRKKVVPPSYFGAPACFDDVCLQALSRWPEGRYATAGDMAQALRRVAEPANLVESRDGVGRWVRRGMGDSLAEQRRRVDYMFGPVASTPKPIAHPPAGAATTPRGKPSAGTGAKRQEWARTQVISRSDVDLALASFNHSRAQSRASADAASPEEPFTDDDHGGADSDDSTDATLVLRRLTPLQRRLVVGLSVAVFVGTVAIGLALTRRSTSGLDGSSAHAASGRHNP